MKENAINSLNYKGRIVGLDAMRAILALFGIFMHSGASYVVIFHGFHIDWYTFFSKQSSFFFSVLVLWIHSFYMPAFFFLSGFLSYKIYKKRKFSGLAHSRLTRIALPFAIAYLFPVIFSLFMAIFLPATRNMTIFNHVLQSLKDTGSFWFLYYLFLMDIAAMTFIGLRNLLAKKIDFSKLRDNKLFNRVGLSFFILLPVVLLLTSSDWFVPVKTSIIPDPMVLTYYTTFFALGWVIQQYYEYLVDFAQQFWGILMAASLVGTGSDLFLQFFYIHSEPARMLGVIACSISALCMFLAALGFCLRTFKKRNRVIQYVSDSSYWLYISQIPFVLFIEQTLHNIHMPLGVKYLITVFLTIGSCLLLYQLIIRKRKLFNYIDCRIKSKNKATDYSKHTISQSQ